MPTMSKIPTTASRPAAVVSGMPWSWAEGMKWVPISPLVVAPQMANPATRAQKVRTLLARLRTCRARTAAFRRGSGFAGPARAARGPLPGAGVLGAAAGGVRPVGQHADVGR